MNMDNDLALTDSEEEEEDEMLLLVFLALLLASRRRRTPYNTSKLTGAEYICEILEGHPKKCYNVLRKESHIFVAFLDYLRSKILLNNSRGVTMLSRSASFETIADRFQHSKETIHRHIKSCFNAITSSTVISKFLKLPSLDTHWKISSSPLYWPYFEHCIGAIDGTHVPMTISSSDDAPYQNRKGTLSQNVMLACDFDMNFLYVSTGWEGSASDAGVLKSAMQSGFHVPRGKFYLVDGGYANTPNFLAPYRGVQYHLQEQGRSNCRPKDYKELFNLRHAHLRNPIECAIGILKKRFPILKVATYYPIENQVKIPAAAAILHNIIRSHNGDEEWLSTEESNISPTRFVDLPSGDETIRDDSTSANSQRNMGNALRDKIAKKMWAGNEISRTRRLRHRTS